MAGQTRDAQSKERRNRAEPAYREGDVGVMVSLRRAGVMVILSPGSSARANGLFGPSRQDGSRPGYSPRAAERHVDR